MEWAQALIRTAAGSLERDSFADYFVNSGTVTDCVDVIFANSAGHNPMLRADTGMPLRQADICERGNLVDDNPLLPCPSVRPKVCIGGL